MLYDESISGLKSFSNRRGSFAAVKHHDGAASNDGEGSDHDEDEEIEGEEKEQSNFYIKRVTESVVFVRSKESDTRVNSSIISVSQTCRCQQDMIS